MRRALSDPGVGAVFEIFMAVRPGVNFGRGDGWDDGDDLAGPDAED